MLDKHEIDTTDPAIAEYEAFRKALWALDEEAADHCDVLDAAEVFNYLCARYSMPTLGLWAMSTARACRIFTIAAQYRAQGVTFTLDTSTAPANAKRVKPNAVTPAWLVGQVVEIVAVATNGVHIVLAEATPGSNDCGSLIFIPGRWLADVNARRTRNLSME